MTDPLPPSPDQGQSSVHHVIPSSQTARDWEMTPCSHDPLLTSHLVSIFFASAGDPGFSNMVSFSTCQKEVHVDISSAWQTVRNSYYHSICSYHKHPVLPVPQS